MYRKHHQKSARASWISKDTWQLAGRRAALQRSGRAGMREFFKAWRDFSARYKRTDGKGCKRWGQI